MQGHQSLSIELHGILMPGCKFGRRISGSSLEKRSERCSSTQKTLRFNKNGELLRPCHLAGTRSLNASSVASLSLRQCDLNGSFVTPGPELSRK